MISLPNKPNSHLKDPIRSSNALERHNIIVVSFSLPSIIMSIDDDVHLPNLGGPDMQAGNRGESNKHLSNTGISYDSLPAVRALWVHTAILPRYAARIRRTERDWF